MIPKNKKRITITIPKLLYSYLETKSKEYETTISKIITYSLDSHFIEYEDDYTYKLIEEIKNDQSKK